MPIGPVTRGPLKGQTFGTRREYRQALAESRGYPSEYAARAARARARGFRSPYQERRERARARREGLRPETVGIPPEAPWLPAVTGESYMEARQRIYEAAKALGLSGFDLQEYMTRGLSP